jgi:hypothetical protein
MMASPTDRGPRESQRAKRARFVGLKTVGVKRKKGK